MASVSKSKFALLQKELTFTSARSSGPGGQNVNKVNTKVTLRFSIQNSEILSEEERGILLRKLANKITKDGSLILSCQEKRSQVQNKELVIQKFLDLIDKTLKKPKARKSTKPSKTSREKRLQKKKEISEKKKWRGKI
ncbi:MAG TPA: alternative ribosome rescue aminoacyl-tRNA hydrolase ArfB [Cyclobacteriaceae bacterium]